MTGPVAMVSAAAGGIGRALTLHLAERGYQLAIADVSERRLGELADDVAHRHQRRPLCLVGDLMDQSVAEAFEKGTTETYGRVDAVANIVGGVRGPLDSFYDRPLEDISLDEWEWTLRINTVPTFLLTKAVSDRMKDQGRGSIVNVASMAYLGSLPRMGNAAYDSAKAAIVALTRTLARQLGPFGIRVNAVAPGLTLSSGLERIVTDELIQEHENTAPLHKVGQPGDVASAMAFLLDDAAGHITGEVIHVAGGTR